SGDSSKARGSENVKYFDVEVSPFVGFKDGYQTGFEELSNLLPAGRKILYATRNQLSSHEGWKLIRLIEGAQFLYLPKQGFDDDFSKLEPLNESHVQQMIELAQLTRPGPFDYRTIEFGNYHGIFAQEKLVAMAGRRLHVYGYVEVSAVCTHPDHLSRGYAASLLKHQVNSILEEGKVPFLHVRSNNTRAIDLYERLGFVRNGGMNFYLMAKEHED
ncbi:MAG: GNAT family N-acetyltransferase, partial [Sphingobacteriales bacterium]